MASKAPEEKPWLGTDSVPLPSAEPSFEPAPGKPLHALVTQHIIRLFRRVKCVVLRVGIDEAVLFTLLGRGWGAFSGLVSLILLTHFLSGAQQGFYMTFADVLGLQVFFELGLAHVLVQFASHERAHLEWTAAGLLEGDPAAKVRLASLLRLIIRWYSVTAVLVLLTLLVGGSAYFLRCGSHYPGVVWQFPWIWIVFVTAGSLAVSPFLALLEGCGLVARIARVQMILAMAGTTLFWVALRCHWGLYTAPITNTIAFAGNVGWLCLTKRRFFADLWSCHLEQAASGQTGIDWKQEIWPLQWKIGISWLSGYFIFRLFNPLLLWFHGPVATGRLGLSLTAVAAVAGISLAWVSTKSSPFGVLVARREFAELDRRFFPCMWQSFFVLVLGTAMIWLATWYLFLSGSPLRLRILEPLPMGLLLAAQLATHFVFCEAIYLRAHKQDPFLAMSLIWGAVVLCLSVLLGIPYGAAGMMLGYFLANLVVGLGGGTWIFLRKRAEWHHPAPTAPGNL